ncbi:MAG: hypothetical protein UY50_C0025G0039 [Parcubacteria group bacterium GW2011_GWA2_49_9]|nr:MAG: hypothetical protein UY50_C0025G0039 [Parcubacteria group bacterium GW2011_GWA2_49_9]
MNRNVESPATVEINQIYLPERSAFWLMSICTVFLAGICIFNFLAIRKLHLQNAALIASNQELQGQLLQLAPPTVANDSPIGLWMNDLKKNTGKLIRSFKVSDGMFFGVVYMDRVNGVLPVWFIGYSEQPKDGSEISFLNHYLRMEGNLNVLAFSKAEPNL